MSHTLNGQNILSPRAIFPICWKIESTYYFLNYSLFSNSHRMNYVILFFFHPATNKLTQKCRWHKICMMKKYIHLLFLCIKIPVNIWIFVLNKFIMYTIVYNFLLRITWCSLLLGPLLSRIPPENFPLCHLCTWNLNQIPIVSRFFF